MSADRPQLRALADRLGVVPSYWDLGGTEHPTSDATAEALCASMGWDASDEGAAERSCAQLDERERGRLIAPVSVSREGSDQCGWLAALHPGSACELEAHVRLTDERGESRQLEARLPAGSAGSAVRLPLPAQPEPGYYEVQLSIGLEGGAVSGKQRLVAAPRTAFTASERLGGGRAFGIWANLYTLRSRDNWGFGNFTDLATLARLCARRGGDFVGVNPVHALTNRGRGIVPYSPVSRLYRNVLYLDIEAVPELRDCEPARRRLAAPVFQEALAALRDAAAIDHERILELELPLLRELHAAFGRHTHDAQGSRAEDYAAYLAAEGQALLDFATFEVLSEHLGGAQQEAPDWRTWPAEYRDPRSEAVERFRLDRAAEVDFRCWLQFELDRQLAAAAEVGRSAGLRIGVYADLAVGSAPDSADTWLAQGVFASGASVGAPPDPYSSTGQDWGLPPADPHALHEDGYRFWTRLLRAGFQHAGALRVDHVMGLQRLFWIPEGRPGNKGAYVRYPLDDLLGVLALESRRHEALVVGEDLGTVPAELPDMLASWGVLSSSVLVFEKDGDAFRPPHAYSDRALVTADTHDLPPLAGYFGGLDLELRRRVGQIASDEELASAREARQRECAALIERLRQESLLPEDGAASPAELHAAVAAFLARTPAPLIGLSLDDLAGEQEPVNLPGVPIDLHPSWTRRMQRTLESLESYLALELAPPNAKMGPGAAR